MLRSLLFSLTITSCFCLLSQSPYRAISEDELAKGNTFPFWERETKYSKTYYVDQGHDNASDRNPGSEDAPFRTISKAAEVLQPGERVLIKGGVYRERVSPQVGGISPKQMITYEAYPENKVIVKGSIIVDPIRFTQKGGWQYGYKSIYNEETDVWEYGLKDGSKKQVPVFQFDLHAEEIGLYNPFAMLNMLHDRSYLFYREKIKMRGHLKRRGMIFLDGDTLQQVFTPVELSDKKKGAFWVEHNGVTIHIRFPDGRDPNECLIEATIKEQVFSPKQYGLGYIKVKGIQFAHTGNGFPVPQRGMLSSNRGNHWVIEDCTFEWANSLAMDLGNESWHTNFQEGLGFHVVRGNTFRNCGLSGLQAMRANSLLIEDNLFERIGWQDAEHGWEAGGIKFHQANNCLIRRNVFRNIKYAPGIWLDYLSTDNCRITKNVFSDITTARGSIYLEVSRKGIRIDHNIFHKTRSQYWISGDYGAGGSALYTDGTDSIQFENNLIIDIENSGYGAYLNASRLVAGRGGITRHHQIKNNIFIDCKKYMIELPNEYHELANNVYSGYRAGYMKIANPTEMFLNSSTWQQLYDTDHGSLTDITVKGYVNTQDLTLSLEINESDIKKFKGIGPFNNYKDLKAINIDPRK